MIEVLLATTLSCSQANALISNVKKFSESDYISNVEIAEVVDIIKEETPECF